MSFIEMTGKTLLRVINDGELDSEALSRVGLNDESVVRVNRQGDVELRHKRSWEVIGGLLGNFEERIRQETHLDWA